MIASTGEKGAKRAMENLENSVVFSVDSGEVSKIPSTEVSHPLVYSHNLQYHGFFSLGGGTLGHSGDEGSANNSALSIHYSALRTKKMIFREKRK